jgi:hypothetical protein
VEGINTNLRVRFNRDQIYTYSGTILIAVNPYKTLPMYEKDIVDTYINRRIGDMPPHIFATAEAAFANVKTSDVNQSCLISGESGSGKVCVLCIVLYVYVSVCMCIGLYMCVCVCVYIVWVNIHYIIDINFTIIFFVSLFVLDGNDKVYPPIPVCDILVQVLVGGARGAADPPVKHHSRSIWKCADNQKRQLLSLWKVHPGIGFFLCFLLQIESV